MVDRVLSIPRVLNMLGLEYTWIANIARLHGFCVNCVLKIHGMLNVLSSKYAKVLNVSVV